MRYYWVVNIWYKRNSGPCAQLCPKFMLHTDYSVICDMRFITTFSGAGAREWAYKNIKLNVLFYRHSKWKHHKLHQHLHSTFLVSMHLGRWWSFMHFAIVLMSTHNTTLIYGLNVKTNNILFSHRPKHQKIILQTVNHLMRTFFPRIYHIIIK